MRNGGGIEMRCLAIAAVAEQVIEAIALATVI